MTRTLRISRLGIWLFAIYMIIILLMLAAAFLGRPDPLSGLGLVILTLPWSYFFGLFVEAVGTEAGGSGPLVGIIVFILLSIPNGVLVYFAGFFLERIVKKRTSVEW